MTGEGKVIEPWLVSGASLYWGAIVASFLFPGEGSSTGFPLNDPIVKYLVLGAFVGIGLVTPKAFSSERGRRCSLIVMLGASLFATVIPSVSQAPALYALATAFHLFAVAVLMVLWGFAFASMDKRHAGQNVTVTMLLAVAIVLAVTILCQSLPIWAIARVLMVVSALVLLSGNVRFHNVRRSRTDHYQPRAVSFFLSRFAFGATMGFGIEAPLRLSTADASLPLFIMGSIVAATAMTTTLRSVGRIYFALPTLILLTVGITYLPFLERGLHSAAEASVGLIWLVWAEFSAFQLSDLKERCGIAELSLCLAEKLTLSLAMVAGVVVCRVLSVTGMLADSTPIELALFALTGILTLGATYITGCLVGERAEDSMRERLSLDRRQHMEAVYDSIAAEYGLSAREREVMSMLAEGYTRAFIRDMLGVSDGTARAHIAHVYAKMNIHRKDDLLEYVDSRIA